MYMCVYIYIHIYINNDTLLDDTLPMTWAWRPGSWCPASCAYFLFLFDPEGLPYKFLVFLLRRWTGDPPETLSGLTSNPLSLTW